jgi:fumarylacetoacetase
MESKLNHTHDPDARSWLDSANVANSDFPIQNLPFAVFRRKSAGEAFRAGVGIGDQVLDLSALATTGLLDTLAAQAAVACKQASLNSFFEMGPTAWRALRHGLFSLLHQGNTSSHRDALLPCLVGQDSVEYTTPARIGDYTDFYTSIDHATNISKLLGLNAVGANFRWIPLGYHGRVSSIDVSGQTFRRPVGQVSPQTGQAPDFQPSAKLDYELELGIFIGQGNPLGEPIALNDAEDHVFGLCLLNDWSARDIQSWEMQPLGPFLSKSFATTISPWIVTMEALAPYRTALPRARSDPESLSYLDSPENIANGAIDIELEVWIESARQRADNLAASRLSHSSFKHQYWTMAQMVTHHAVNGCNLRAGDLLGSGTISGPGEAEAGALMELARNGATPVTLPTGEQRSYIEDGDAVILRGYCHKPGFARIGFGESRGEVLPARSVGSDPAQMHL